MKSFPHWLAILSVFAGCSTSATIEPAGSSRSRFDGAVYPGVSTVISAEKSGAEEYRVYQEASTSLVSMQSVRDEAEQRMKEFCERKSRSANPLSERVATPPFILGNSPRIEIVFSCLDRPAAANPSNIQDPKFVKLMNLKKLLDDKIITQKEFDAEKAKILSQP